MSEWHHTTSATTTSSVRAREMPPSARKRSSSAVAVAGANKRGRAAGVAAVGEANRRGAAVINHGAGTMPVDAPAPHGGQRYTLLEDTVDAPRPYHVAAHAGDKDTHGKLRFADAPDFQPSLTPAECLHKGVSPCDALQPLLFLPQPLALGAHWPQVFGGCYFNPRGGKPGIFGREVSIDVSEFPAAWFDDLPESMYASRRYHLTTNHYRVKSGFGQKEWEAKGWIHAQDPRGWFQWYCRFFCGRRSADDARQIARWCACASPRGRWRNQLCGAVCKAGAHFDDAAVSPVIRQTLLHWAYELSETDYGAWRVSRSK